MMISSLFRKQALEHYTDSTREASEFLKVRHRMDKRAGKVRVVMQANTVDCGAACLVMVLHSFGIDVNTNEVRNRLQAGRDGATARALVSTAKQFGLTAEGYSVQAPELRLIDLPCIAFWAFSHYVVICRVTRHHVEIADPAVGRRLLRKSEFLKSFTGVVLQFTLAESTSAQPSKNLRRSALNRIVGVIAQTRHRLAMVLLLSIILQLFGLALPWTTGYIVDQLIPRASYHLAYMIIAGCGILAIGYMVSTLFRSLSVAAMQALIDEKIMKTFIQHLLRLPYSYFQIRSSGDLLLRLNSNTVLRELLTQQMLSSMLDGTMILVYVGILYAVSAALASIVLIAVIIDVLMAILSVKLLKSWSDADVDAQAKSQNFTVELLRGMETIKSLSIEDIIYDKWSLLFVRQLNTFLSRRNRSSVFSAIADGLHFGLPLLVLSVGVLFVLDGQLTIGRMLGFAALAAAVFAPLAALVANIQRMQLAGTHLSRLEDVFEAKPEGVSDGVQRQLLGAVTLRDASFHYLGAAVDVLREISADIPRGGLTLIVGESGAGKSTLGKLIVALHVPSAGSILYDGQDGRQLDLAALRGQMAVVSQDPFLFNMSIRANICYGHSKVSAADIEHAAHVACVDRFIASLPMGYETLVAENASNISGGQKQRICIARAVIRRPKILLLDEATNQMDRPTETSVMTQLIGLPTTKIFVTHRLHNAKLANRVLVMREGSLVAQGTHAQLLHECDYYRRLHAERN